MKKRNLILVAPITLLLGCLASCNNNPTKTLSRITCTYIASTAHVVKSTDLTVIATYKTGTFIQDELISYKYGDSNSYSVSLNNQLINITDGYTVSEKTTFDVVYSTCATTFTIE